MSDITQTILFGVAMVLLLGLSIFIQVLRTRRAPLGKVIGILSNVKYNQKLCNNFSYHRSIGRLKAKGWEKGRDKVMFLPHDLLDNLSGLFGLVAEMNDRIDEAIRHKSDSYMAAIEVDKLKEPLETCREQLQTWIQENMNNPEYLPKKRSLFRR